MSRFAHEYSAEQWVDFVEGMLDREASALMRDHITGCDQCRLTYEDLVLSRSHLEQLSLRLSFISAEASERIHNAVLARIRMAQAASAGESITVGVNQLRSIIEPLCGQATTERAILSAALSCGAANSDQVETRQWMPFVGQLGTIVDTLCGASVAQWIWETARDIHWEEGL